MPTPTSPNMGLPIPIPTVTEGAQYAYDEQTCFNVIDSHNHTSGSGVQIPTGGLNINASLPMNNYGLLNAQLVNLQAQGSISTSGSIFRISDDLYYKDGSGNNVRITQSGSVAVSGAIGFTGLPSGTASASYAASTFVFESATNTPANIDGASITIRPLAASPQGITISAPALLAADYTLELPPALPASDSFVQVASTGSVSFQSLTNLLPSGMIMMYGGSVAPVGWFICDGTVLSQATYANLFAAIGNSFDTGGEGAGNFRLPDFRRKVGVGAGGTGSATLGNAVGNSGGAESVALSVSEMPSHNHGGSTGSSTVPFTAYTNGASPGNNSLDLSIYTTSGFSGTIPNSSHTHSISSQGGGSAHNNIQPSLVVNYIIKY